MYKILMILTVTATLFFTACGGDSNNTSPSKSNEDNTTTNTATNITTPPQKTSSIKMIKDQTYTLSSGQSIKKESSSTEVVIEIDTSTRVTTATLKSGSASIVTKSDIKNFK